MGTVTRNIPFTQYLMPDGRPVQMLFEPAEGLPDEVFDMADSLILNGYAFESEMLYTGEVSFDCGREDETLAVAVCANGPQVVPTICQLVLDAYREMIALSRD